MTETETHAMNRRQLIRHSAWFGAAVGLAVAGGEVVSHVAGAAAPRPVRPVRRCGSPRSATVTSASPGTANPNVTDTFTEAIDQINSLGYTPDFVIHTGDLTHLATPDQFDQVKQMMTGLKTPHVFTVPGEHDSIDDAGQKYRKRLRCGHPRRRLVQLRHRRCARHRPGQHAEPEEAWAPGPRPARLHRQGRCGLSSDTPIIVFSHIPLFAMYPGWGWGTDDAAQALSYLQRFSSVTCLNGHVHQVFSKIEGNVTFHSGTTTAYPLPHPGHGPAPKPVTLPAGKLKDALGIREVSYTRGQSALALKERTLQ